MIRSDMETLKITKTFLYDHEDRGLPMPNIVKETKQYAWIEINFTHAGYMDLMKDAEFYGWDMADGGNEDWGLHRAARNLYFQIEETMNHESWERQDSSDWFQNWFSNVEREIWESRKPRKQEPKTEVPTMETLLSKKEDSLRTIAKAMGYKPNSKASKQEIAELLLEEATQ